MAVGKPAMAMGMREGKAEYVVLATEEAAGLSGKEVGVEVEMARVKEAVAEATGT